MTHPCETYKFQFRPLPDLIDLILAENEKRVENGVSRHSQFRETYTAAPDIHNSFEEKPLHHDIVVSNAWALFFAGYETTSTALAFASYLLAKHPEVIRLHSNTSIGLEFIVIIIAEFRFNKLFTKRLHPHSRTMSRSTTKE